LGLPRWARYGLIALAAVVVALMALVVIRVVTRVPPIPLGATAAADLREGSCLAEAETDLSQYTVVACDEPHPQQVFAVADLELDDNVYAVVDASLATFGDEVCDRYLEYRLYLDAALVRQDYRTSAIAVPDADAYADGRRHTLCAIARDDEDPMSGSVYRAMP